MRRVPLEIPGQEQLLPSGAGRRRLVEKMDFYGTLRPEFLGISVAELGSVDIVAAGTLAPAQLEEHLYTDPIVGIVLPPEEYVAGIRSPRGFKRSVTEVSYKSSRTASSIQERRQKSVDDVVSAQEARLEKMERVHRGICAERDNLQYLLRLSRAPYRREANGADLKIRAVTAYGSFGKVITTVALHDGWSDNQLHDQQVHLDWLLAGQPDANERVSAFQAIGRVSERYAANRARYFKNRINILRNDNERSKR